MFSDRHLGAVGDIAAVRRLMWIKTLRLLSFIRLSVNEGEVGRCPMHPSWCTSRRTRRRSHLSASVQALPRDQRGADRTIGARNTPAGGGGRHGH